MQRKSISHSHPFANALNRGFWVLMLFAHAPALISAWRCCLAEGLQLDMLGGCVVLTASMVFFVLKLRDIGWLRFRTDRRSLLALGLVVALIHLDCLQPGLRTEVASKCAVVLVTTAIVVAIPRMIRLLRAGCAERGTTRRCRLSDGRFLDKTWLDTSQPRCWVLARNLFRLRAPPA